MLRSIADLSFRVWSVLQKLQSCMADASSEYDCSYYVTLRQTVRKLLTCVATRVVLFASLTNQTFWVSDHHSKVVLQWGQADQRCTSRSRRTEMQKSVSSGSPLREVVFSRGATLVNLPRGADTSASLATNRKHKHKHSRSLPGRSVLGRLPHWGSASEFQRTGFYPHGLSCPSLQQCTLLCRPDHAQWTGELDLTRLFFCRRTRENLLTHDTTTRFRCTAATEAWTTFHIGSGSYCRIRHPCCRTPKFHARTGAPFGVKGLLHGSR